MAKVYATVREARNALCLDTGFDPFISGGWGRCTKQRLAEAGYIVDPKKAAEMSREHRCRVCQAKVERDFDGIEYGDFPDHCPAHRKWRRECDEGHVWWNTDSEAELAGHKCPKCGGYSV